MQKAKSILALALAVLLAVGAGAVPALAAADMDDVVGSVQDGVYVNEFFDIAFAPPADWTFFSDEELVALLGAVQEVAGDSAARDALEQFASSGTGGYVMYAYSSDGLENVNVIVQDLSYLGAAAASVTEQDMLEAGYNDAMTALADLVGEMDSELGTTVIAGQEHPSLDISYDGAAIGADAHVYQRMVYIIHDGYCFQITLTSLGDPAGLEDIAPYFMSTDGASPLGAVDGQRYVNQVFDLDVELPEGWTFDNGSPSEGLIATSADQTMSLILAVDDSSSYGDLSEEDALAMMIPSGDDILEACGADDGTVTNNTFDIAGQPHPGLRTEAVVSANGVDVDAYIQIVVIVADGYAMGIGLSTVGVDAIDELAGIFSPLYA